MKSHPITDGFFYYEFIYLFCTFDKKRDKMKALRFISNCLFEGCTMKGLFISFLISFYLAWFLGMNSTLGLVTIIYIPMIIINIVKNLFKNDG